MDQLFHLYADKLSAQLLLVEKENTVDGTPEGHRRPSGVPGGKDPLVDTFLDNPYNALKIAHPLFHILLDQLVGEELPSYIDIPMLPEEEYPIVFPVIKILALAHLPQFSDHLVRWQIKLEDRLYPIEEDLETLI